MKFNLIKSNLTYAVGSIANSAALLLLVPILVRTFSEEEYGSWSLLEVTITLLTALMNVGLNVGLIRHYWFLEQEKQRRELFSTVLITSTVWGGILCTLGSILISNGFHFGLANQPSHLLWVLLISWLESIFNLFLALLRIQEKAQTFIGLSIGRLVLFLCGVILLLHNHSSITSVLIIRFGSSMLALVIAAVVSKEYLIPHFNRGFSRDVLRYSLPLLGSDLAGYILFASDRYILQAYTGLESIAIYTFAYKLATTVDILVNRPFALDWASRRFKIAAEPSQAQQKYADILLFYLVSIVSIALLVIAATPLAYQWFAPPSYQQGSGLVALLIISYMMFGLSQPLNIGIMLQDKTKYLPLISWSAAIVCLILNFWWISQYGMWGAAWATFVAYTTMTMTIAIVSLRLYRIRYRLDQITWILGIGLVGFVGLSYLEQSLHNFSIYLSFGIKLGWLLFLFITSSISAVGFGNIPFTLQTLIVDLKIRHAKNVR